MFTFFRNWLQRRQQRAVLDKQFRLIEARQRARESGIGSGDPNYPDLWDIIGEEPVIPLPHRTARLAARAKLAESTKAPA